MVISSRKPSRTVLALKLVFVAVGLVSSFFFVKTGVPLIVEFLLLTIPRLWSGFCLWLTPPYLYIVINAIIITIAAASGFQNKVNNSSGDDPVIQKLDENRPVAFEVQTPVTEIPQLVEHVPAVFSDLEMKSTEREVKSVKLDGDAEEEDFICRSNWMPAMGRVSMDLSSEELSSMVSEVRPLLKERIGHRKSVKSSPEGKLLGVNRSRRVETLENTWKTITDGRPIPLTRHLKKSETWETNHHRPKPDPGTPIFRKSETVKERGETTPSPANSGGKSSGLKRESSLSQDDLNRRVEAFIKKFNEDMRLQRQESFKQYMDMVHHGAGEG